jgi:hypothetical protein
MLTFATADGGGLAVLNADDDFVRGFPDPSTWPLYQKKVPTKALRINEPFEVRTSEGPLVCQSGYLCLDARGYPYPVAADEFDLIYRDSEVEREDQPTMVQQMLALQARLADLRNDASAARRPDAAREYSIAITLSEDLIMRINRGMAKDNDSFTVADVEQLRLDSQ